MKPRSELKGYFITDATPTEGHFAELVDSSLNQADDGVSKTPGNPLAIVPAGATRQALLFSGGPNAPAAENWRLDLTALDAGTNQSRPGFSITNGSGISRLFIDQATGNVGIGHTNPAAALHVKGVVKAAGLDVESGGTSRLYIDPATGNVGVGTGSPGALLHVAGDILAGGLVTSGNIGAGTMAPLGRLHVQGNVIVLSKNANTAESKALLSDARMPNNSLVIGGCWSNSIYFFWKDESGKHYQATLGGSAF